MSEIVKNFKIEKTSDEVFYFNYKSLPGQIVEKGGQCDACYENILDYVSELPEEESKCPNCGEKLYFHSKCANEFFETDEDDDAIAGFAYETHNEQTLDGKNVTGVTATITFQGIINFDKETVQIVSYDDDGNGVLGEEKPLSDFGISEFGWASMDDAKTRLDLFTDEWGIQWEKSDILDNELEEVN